MKRYTFLLLAFFLANNLNAEGIVSGDRIASVKSATETDIKRTSTRNAIEVGNIVEPIVSGSTSIENQLNTNTNGTGSTQNTKTTKASSNSGNCKTYQGHTYEHGEPGYTDCMLKIRSDRQGTRSVP